jgi:hypothetical protein
VRCKIWVLELTDQIYFEAPRRVSQESAGLPRDDRGALSFELMRQLNAVYILVLLIIMKTDLTPVAVQNKNTITTMLDIAL